MKVLKKSSTPLTDTLSLQSTYRVSVNYLDNDNIEFGFYNPSSQYKLKEVMNIEDDIDNFVDLILSDTDLYLERSEENISTISDFIENCWK